MAELKDDIFIDVAIYGGRNDSSARSRLSCLVFYVSMIRLYVSLCRGNGYESFDVIT